MAPKKKPSEHIWQKNAHKKETSSVQDKAEIKSYLAKIQKLLKDPQNAKKAAMIIESMLSNKKK